MKITENCIINAMPEAAYHADPTPELGEGWVNSSSFSSSMANALLTSTEEEAFISSQRLNPKYEPRKSDAMDLGNMAHNFILLGERGTFEVAPFDSWRTKASKEAKADIESRGLIALNENTASIVDDVRNMKDALHKQLDAHKDYPGLMRKGKGEQSAFALDPSDGVWNRARFDWLDELYPDVIVDYKTTAIPFERWEKGQLWSDGKFIQNPHYRRTYDLITGRKSKFIWVVQQVKAPYQVRIFEIDESFMCDVDGRYNRSRRIFANCLKTGEWRGQPPHSYHSCPPAWTVQQWELDDLNTETLEKKEAPEPEKLMSAG